MTYAAGYGLFLAAVVASMHGDLVRDTLARRPHTPRGRMTTACVHAALPWREPGGCRRCIQVRPG